jgi:ABC-type transporter Mla MlaB component
MSTDESTIRLDGELTIYQVGERHEQLLLALQQCASGQSLYEQSSEKQPSLTIDTSELIEVDSAGLQLLVQLAQHARQLDVAIDWKAPGTALTQMIDLYNAGQWFETTPKARQS